MHIMKRMLALCLALLLLTMTAAQADVPFLMHSSNWNLDGMPVEALLKVDVDTHMPFDEDRLAMLTPITDILSLRLVTGDNEGLVTIGIADLNALTLQYRGNEVRLSCLPDVVYSAEEDPMSMLLGGDTFVPGGYEALGLAPQGESLLIDGRTLLARIPEVLDKYGKKYQSATNISGYGKSTYRIDYSFTAAKADEFQKAILSACPDGWLKEILAGLTFSGKQTLRLYFDANDTVLRVEFNGSCGPAGDLRTVKLVCRLRHDDEMDKEYIELTTPAKKGKNKNNLTFERTVQTNKKGARTIVGSFKYTATKDGVTSIWDGSFNLKNSFTDNADIIGGDFTVQKKLNGSEKYEAITIVPDLTISGEEDAPNISGSITVTEQYAGKVTEQAKVSVTLKRAEPLAWEPADQVVNLSAMDEQELKAVQQDVAATVSTAIVRPLIVLLGEDAEYFFRDLPEEAVEDIVDAASQAAE